MSRLILVLAICLSFVGPAHAASEGIAAVVNEDIITTTDLKDRAEMIVKSSGKPASASVIERIKPQALEGLIAEVVQIQEARRQGIVITDEEVEGGLASIAQNNNMPAEKFLGLLRKQGVRISSIKAQIRAQLGWNKVIQQVIRPRVIVGESEIKAERERMNASSGKREFYTAEIFLPVSDTSDEGSVRGLAQTLANEIRKGKPFPEAAHQHSQSASAAAGGMIGWVTEGQLEPALNRALLTLKPGTVSDPIKGDDGYYLLFVREARASNVATPDDAVLSIRELVIDTTGLREREAEQEAERMAKDLTGCLDITKKAASDKRFRLVERKVSLGELTPSEKERLGKMAIGEAVMPAYAPNMAVISMVCGRDEPSGNVATDTVLERKIGIQRLDMLQKRYLRDLISSAYIERRI